MKNSLASAKVLTPKQMRHQKVFVRRTLTVSLLGMLGSFSLQALGVQPCVYCWILRALTITVFFVSLIGLKLKSKEIVAKPVAVSSLLGMLVSVYLIHIESSDSHSLLCAITKLTCSSPPTIFGFTPSAYALGMFLFILGLSISGMMPSGSSAMKRILRVKLGATTLMLVTLTSIMVAPLVFSAGDQRSVFEDSDGSYVSRGNSLSSKIDPILNSGKIVLLYFYEENCYACRLQKPILEQLEKEYFDEVVFVRADGPKNRKAMAEWGVRGFPTMLLIYRKNAEGYEYKVFEGYTGRSLLKDAIDNLIRPRVEPLKTLERRPPALVSNKGSMGTLVVETEPESIVPTEVHDHKDRADYNNPTAVEYGASYSEPSIVVNPPEPNATTELPHQPPNSTLEFSRLSGGAWAALTSEDMLVSDSDVPMASSPVIPPFEPDRMLPESSAEAWVNEPSIAVNPLKPNNLVAGYHDYGYGPPNWAGCVWSYSFDGGHMWTFGGVMPAIQSGDKYSDPVLAADELGNFYYNYMSIRIDGSTADIVVAKSTDGGRTFPTYSIVYSGVAWSTLPDKNWIDVDTWPSSPYKGRIYVTYTRFTYDVGIGDFKDGRIWLHYSTNRGATWSSGILVASSLVAGGEVQGSQPSAAPDGTLYVALLDRGTWPTRGDERVTVVRSSNGGLSIDLGPVTAVPTHASTRRGGLDPTVFRGESFPFIDVGPEGNVYVVYAHDPGSTTPGADDDGDIGFARSTNRGLTWTTITWKVNDDATDNDQWWPAIKVEEDDGTIHLVWLDRRLDVADTNYHTYYAYSIDGGATFPGSDVRVSTVASDPTGETFIGDYIDVDASAYRVHPIWTDLRTGLQDIYVSRGWKKPLGLAVISSTGVDGSVLRAVEELDYDYDYYYVGFADPADFPYNYSRYRVIVQAMDGGTVLEIPRIADFINNGGRAILLGGSGLPGFVSDVNTYLMSVDTTNYLWTTVAGTPDITIVDPSHRLARDLPATYDFVDNYATFYMLRITDTVPHVVATNGDGYKAIVMKTMGNGWFTWFINSPYQGYWANAGDYAYMKRFLRNALRPAVALLGSDYDSSIDAVRAYLLPFSDLTIIDTINVRYSTPSLATLLNYDSVLVWSNFGFADPVALGDVLADYVDSEGGVVLTTFAWYGPTYDLEGRIVTDYSPFVQAGPSLYSWANLSWSNPLHPIMAGVSSVSGYFRDNVTLSLGADYTEVATWSDGYPFVATKESVVGVTLFPSVVGSPSDWTGDVPTLIHNALIWSAGAPTPLPGNWRLLATDPDEGAGTSLKAIYGQVYSDVIYFMVEHYRMWPTYTYIDTAILIDADENASTGLPDGYYPGQNTGIGADYLLEVGWLGTVMWKWDPIAGWWDLINHIALAYIDAPGNSTVFVAGVYKTDVTMTSALDIAVTDVPSAWDWMPDAGHFTIIVSPPPIENWILLATDPDEGFGTSLKAIYGQVYSGVIYFKVEHYRPWETIFNIDTAILIDADENVSTGLPDGTYPGQLTGIGADYMLLVGWEGRHMLTWDPIAGWWDTANPTSPAYLEALDGTSVFVVGVYLSDVTTAGGLDIAVTDVPSAWDWMPDAGHFTINLFGVCYDYTLSMWLVPPTTGDWVVTTVIECNSTVITVNGNLTIHGSLSFNNVRLRMNSTYMGEYGIEVNTGGAFYINSLNGAPSVITNGDNATAYYTFQVKSGSVFEMRNSELHNAGFAWNLPDYSWAGLWINTDSVLIDNSTISNNHFVGILLYNSVNHIITNNIIRNNDWYGIWGINTPNNVITGNEIYSNGIDGISLSYASGTTIDNNTVYSNGYNGIEVYSGTTITNNNASGNGDDGIVVTGSPWSTIFNNTANDNGDNGIVVGSSPNSGITNNTANGNGDNGIDVYSSDNSSINYNTANNNGDDGIFVSSSLAPTIMHNTANFNFVEVDIGTGIVVISSPNAYVSNNTANSNWRGIHLVSSPNSWVYFNVVNDNTWYGIHLYLSPTTEIQWNDVSLTTGEWDSTGVYLSYSGDCILQYNQIYSNLNGMILWNSPGATIQFNEVNSNSQRGISLQFSGYATIANNNPNSNGHGISLSDSNYVNINTNNATLNSVAGISLYSSHYAAITNNNASNNGYGIYLGGSTNNLIDFNLVENNTYGIYLSSSSWNMITNNSAENNYFGLSLWWSSNNNHVENNDFDNSLSYGAYVYSSHYNNLTLNDLRYSLSVGIHLEWSNNNLLYLNNATWSENYGIDLFESDWNDIKKNDVRFSTDVGIGLSSSHNNSILNNNAQGSGIGISLRWSNWNIIQDNTANSNNIGISLLQSNNNDIINNAVSTNNNIGIELSISSYNDISNNTANNNSDYGIHLYSSHYNNITNNDPNSNGVGIFLDWSTNNLISGNIVNFNNLIGIAIYWQSDNNEIITNNVNSNYNISIRVSFSHYNLLEDNQASYSIIGIHLDWSENNQIINNTANFNIHGISLEWFSDNNQILNNKASNSTVGISLERSSNNTVSYNNATFNRFGILLEWSSNNNTVISNIMAYNDYHGISFHWESNYNVVRNNTIGHNYRYGLYVHESSNNTIYHNDIIYNIIQAFDLTPADNDWHHPGLLEGNYWSDYPGLDDGSGTGKHAIAGDGIGDTDIPWPSTDYDFYPLISGMAVLTHNVAITDVAPSPRIVGQGYSISISVTVENLGASTQTFNVSAYANTTMVDRAQVTLTSGSSITITFTWNTTSFAYGNYIIRAYATPIPVEIYTGDTLANGVVMVTIPGDVNGDRIVDIFDIGTISAHWYPGPPIGPLGYHPNADVNNDGAVDIFDIGITSAHWGQTW